MNDKKNKKDYYYNKVQMMPKTIRILIGFLLVFFGILGFLPIVGFWMIPLGLMVLAIDFPVAKRCLIKLKYLLRKFKRYWKKQQLAKKNR